MNLTPVLFVAVQTKIVSVMNAREHWAIRARRAKNQRALTLTTLRYQASRKVELPCVVTITRVAPRSLDGDNLQAGCKAIRDGVADWLGLDDADPRVTWRYEQERGAPRQYMAIVEFARAE